MAIINKGMSRRSFLGLTGSVAAVAGLGLTGCGGSSSDEGSASGSTDSANRGGGVITAGSAYAPSSFDPASTGSAVGLGANWHVVEGLYGIDYHDYSTFNELATDDPKSVDDTTFEVTIRKGAKFSDGTEVTADDVVASYTACAASATYAPFFQPFESIEAKDASTVTVKTKVPNFSLLKDRLAIVRVTPATQTEEDRAKQPIGSGPWMYDSISDTEITLVPNPEYNGEYAAEDKKIQYSILTDPTARVTAQQEGSTLVMELVTADAVDQLESAGCKIDNVQGFGTRFIMFNVAKEPWNNVKVRQAVMYALDTEKMVSNTFAGLATAASCYLPKSFTNYHEASTVYKTDAKKAKKLIEESGVTPGAITLRTTDNAGAARLLGENRVPCTLEDGWLTLPLLSDADNHQVDVVDRPVVGFAVTRDARFGHRPVGNMDVFGQDIDMVEKLLVDAVVAALRLVGPDRVEFVEAVNRDVRKTHHAVPVAANQLVVKPQRRSAGRESQHEGLHVLENLVRKRIFVVFLDRPHDQIGDIPHAFGFVFKDRGGNLFIAADDVARSRVDDQSSVFGQSVFAVHIRIF